MTKKKYSKIFKITLGILVIIIAFLISNKIKENFPPILLEQIAPILVLENNTGTQFHYDGKGNIIMDSMGKSKYHQYCPEGWDSSTYYKWQHKVNENYIREGDPLVIKSNFISNDTTKKYPESMLVLVGLEIDKLKPIKAGENEITIVYHRDKKYEIHLLFCINEKKMNEGGHLAKFNLKFIFERPSYFENSIFYWITVISIIVLLGELIRLAEYFFFKSI